MSAHRKQVVIAVVIAEPGAGPLAVAEQLVEVRTDLLTGPPGPLLDRAQTELADTFGQLGAQAYQNAFPREEQP